MFRILFNKWNTSALLLLIFTFSFGTYWVRQKMQHQSNIVSQSMIHGSTRGYQKFLNQYFDSYNHVLNELDKVEQASEQAHLSVQEKLDLLLNMDTTIVALAIMDQNHVYKTQTEGLTDSLPDIQCIFQSSSGTNQKSRIYSERYLFIGGSIFNNPKRYRGIIIDLYRLHQAFIANNIYTSVYQVIINQNQECIYHPEIEMIGKPYSLPNYLFTNDHYNYGHFDSLAIDQSTYLNLPAYKKYSLMSFRDEEWIVLSVTPGFEVKDIITEQESNMLLLFLLFVTTLMGILIFSILHWKHEFLLRSSAEQETLNIMLKHEKQKSDTISIKLELLRSGLNSHFMFNSLGTVKALLSKDDKVARTMLTNLSHLYRYQLRIEGEQMVTLQEELTFTQRYVDVINLRMNSSIQMEINNLSEYLNFKVLPVSLQLLVENCIKHNIASINNPLKITLRIEDERIYVINDLRPKVAIVETNGKGLKNLNTRYSLITQQECTFKQENNQFIASMPLIKQE